MASTKVSDQARSAISAQVISGGGEVFTNLTRAIYVGGSGDLTVVFNDDVEITFVGAAAGYHPLQVKEVKAATTATNLVALF